MKKKINKILAEKILKREEVNRELDSLDFTDPLLGDVGLELDILDAEIHLLQKLLKDE